MRTRRVGDIDTDHHLVVAKMELKLKKHCITRKTALQRFNAALFRDTDKLNEFKITLNNRSQALQDLLKEKTNMEDNWKVIREALTSTYQERNEKTAVNEGRTRAEKFKAQAEYTEANKEAKKSIRGDKQRSVEDLATTAGKAARERSMKKLYNTTEKLTGKYSKPERQVKDKEEKPTPEIQGQRNRWVENPEELSNRQALSSPLDIGAAPTDLLIDVTSPTIE
ncbi:unnamed protein product [Schistosoma mattheei]|uniref:Uncharacterized protein n=1 Tax=Schistosoma mattheei TaxID=31246 RepID=A0A183PHI8_9TREM|nr:unnamed protein product [Schistosoma mattheei]